MSRKSKEIITLTREELNSVIAQAVAQALAQGKPVKKATGKAQPKAEKVAFTKHDGTVIYGTAKQVAAWKAYSERASKPHRTKEELSKMSEGFKFTKAMDAYIKANPSCSKKDFNEKFGFKGMTKQMLSDRKVELKVR